MNNMDISSFMLILFPSLVLMSINFSKCFDRTNLFVVFAECIFAFVLFYVGLWFAVDHFWGEQISWVIYILAVWSLSLYTVVLFFRCVKLCFNKTKKWLLLIIPVALFELYCLKFICNLYC